MIRPKGGRFDCTFVCSVNRALHNAQDGFGPASKQSAVGEALLPLQIKRSQDMQAEERKVQQHLKSCAQPGKTRFETLDSLAMLCLGGHGVPFTTPAVFGCCCFGFPGYTTTTTTNTEKKDFRGNFAGPPKNTLEKPGKPNLAQSSLLCGPSFGKEKLRMGAGCCMVSFSQLATCNESRFLLADCASRQE